MLGMMQFGAGQRRRGKGKEVVTDTGHFSLLSMACITIYLCIEFLPCLSRSFYNHFYNLDLGNVLVTDWKTVIFAKWE